MEDDVLEEEEVDDLEEEEDSAVEDDGKGLHSYCGFIVLLVDSPLDTFPILFHSEDQPLHEKRKAERQKFTAKMSELDSSMADVKMAKTLLDNRTEDRFSGPNESSLHEISREPEDVREIQTKHIQHSENFSESLSPTNWAITYKKNLKAMKLDVLTLMRRQKEHSLGILPLHQLCLEFIRFFLHSYGI